MNKNTYFVNQNLFLGCYGQHIDIGDDYSHDKVSHYEGAEDDEANEKDHSENKGEEVLLVRVLVEVIELEFPKDHDNDLQEALAGVIKLVPLTVIADHKECKTKRDDHDDE